MELEDTKNFPMGLITSKLSLEYRSVFISCEFPFL